MRNVVDISTLLPSDIANKLKSSFLSQVRDRSSNSNRYLHISEGQGVERRVPLLPVSPLEPSSRGDVPQKTFSPLPANLYLRYVVFPVLPSITRNDIVSIACARTSMMYCDSCYGASKWFLARSSFEVIGTPTLTCQTSLTFITTLIACLIEYSLYLENRHFVWKTNT